MGKPPARPSFNGCYRRIKREGYKLELEQLLGKRANQPSRISIAEMPEEKRCNKLITEIKKLKNAVIMVVCRAESALYSIMSAFYKDNKKEGRVIL